MDPEKKFVCDVPGCGLAFKFRNQKSRHKRADHSGLPESSTDTDADDLTRGPQISPRTKRKRAEGLSEQPRKKVCHTECSVCRKVCASADELLHHMLNYHRPLSGEAPTHKCLHCPFSCPTLQNLREHVVRKHKTPEASTEAGTSRGHPESSDTEMNTGTATSTEEAMSNYSAVSTTDYEGPKHECAICNLSFPTKSSLLFHKHREHSEGSSALCDSCGQMFPSEFLLNIHGKRQHDPSNDSPALFEQTRSSAAFNKKFKCSQEFTGFRFTQSALERAKAGEILEILHEVFEKIFEPYRHSKTYVQMAVMSTSLETPISTRLQKAENFNTSDLIEAAANAIQSQKEMPLEDGIDVSIRAVQYNEGGRNPLKQRSCRTALEFAKRKKCLWSPKTGRKPNCLGACIACFLLKRECQKKDPDFKIQNAEWYHHPRTSAQLKLRTTLVCRAAGVSEDKPCGPDEWTLFQNYLDQFGIVLCVYNHDALDELEFGEGKVVSDPALRLSVVLIAQHYYLLTGSTRALLVDRQLCDLCAKIYSGKSHSCCRKCSQCRTADCLKIPKNEIIYCDMCNKSFQSRECYEFHLPKTCIEDKRCEHCLKALKKGQDHFACTTTVCPNCKQQVQYNNHLCFVTPPDPEGENRKSLWPNKFLYCVFDYETALDPITMRQEPMLVVSTHICHICFDDDNIDNHCPAYGQRTFVFRGESASEDFCDYLFFDKRNVNAIALAHNSARFDTFFLLNYLITNGIKPERFLSRGNKIILLKAGANRISAKDTYLYLSCPLKALPSMFGFEQSVTKGLFPHRFNTKNNWSYNADSLPPINYYGLSDFKTVEEKNEFMEWYEQHKNDHWNFWEECISYCRDDVAILARAVKEFQKIGIELNQINPWTSATTIASYCSLVYRKNHLPVGKLGIVPLNGYSCPEGQSLLAVKQLEWLAKSTNQEINHIKNTPSSELSVGRYKIDGYIKSSEGKPEIFEVNGCYFHDNCPECYPGTTLNLLRRCPMRALYDQWLRKKKYLTDSGYKLTTIWEHEINSALRKDREMMKFFNTPFLWYSFGEPIMPRDALYGGRTECVKLLAQLNDQQLKDGWVIKYSDIISLYPFSEKANLYPLKHPKVVTAKDLPQNGTLTIEYLKENLFGLLKVKIISPRDLRIPVIPTRTRNKLIFGLCRKCCEINNTKVCVHSCQVCSHSEDERAFYGCYTSRDIEDALRYNYRVLNIFEAWVYDERGDLFSSYVDTFVRVKQQASGWPESVHCKTGGCSTRKNICDECPICISGRKSYMQSYKEQEGIELDESKIAYNSGFRAVAKVVNNSLWGKMGEQIQCRSNTMYLTKYSELVKVIQDRNLQITGMQLASPEVLVCTYDETKFETTSPFYSPIIYFYVVASMVTANARSILNAHLQRLPDNILYYDTDSLIYTVPPGGFVPPHGSLLGDLSDEIASDDFITSFVSSGAKVYAYKTFRNKEEVKMKGFSLRCDMKPYITFDAIKSVVLGRLGVLGSKERTIRKTIWTKRGFRVSYTKTEPEIFKRLEENIKQQYNRITDPELRARLMSKHKPFSLAVANPNMIKSRFTAEITMDPNAVKLYKQTYDKRVLLPSGDTIPFGYVNCTCSA